MTETDLTDLADAARAIEADVAARRTAADEAEQLAQAAEAEAAQARETASRAQTVATRGRSQPLMEQLRAIGAEIDAARTQAIAAVRAGEDVADEWCRYRLVTAKALGRWQAVADRFVQVSAVDRPPPQGPETRHPPLPGQLNRGSQPKEPEGLAEFLNSVLNEIEPKTRAQARAEAAETLRADRR